MSGPKSHDADRRDAGRLDAERWQRLKIVLSEALERPSDERAAWVDSASLDDEDRRRIHALIGAYEAEPDFLEPPSRI